MKNKLIKIYNILLKTYGKQGWWPLTSEGKIKPIHSGERPRTSKQRFEIIVGAILTQNTAWQNVEKAITNLNKAKLLDIKKISKINKEKLAKLIKPSGYYKQKAERLKLISNYILNNYKDIENFFKKPLKELRQELLSLKGIGKETADSILLYAAEKPIFVIDAYTKRIFSRLGFFNENINYDKAQEFFMQQLPKNIQIFKEYHALIVKHAKERCKKKPDCINCVLNNICKYKENKKI